MTSMPPFENRAAHIAWLIRLLRETDPNNVASVDRELIDRVADRLVQEHSDTLDSLGDE